TIYAKAIDALRNAVATKPIIFELLPKAFTLPALQNIYEQIFDTTIDKRNFYKKIHKMHCIVESETSKRGGQFRPAKLYQFNKKRYLENKNINMLSPIKQ